MFLLMSVSDESPPSVMSSMMFAHLLLLVSKSEKRWVVRQLTTE